MPSKLHRNIACRPDDRHFLDRTFIYGPNSAGVRIVGQVQYEPFDQQTTLFHRLRDRGINCGVVTYYHPLRQAFRRLGIRLSLGSVSEAGKRYSLVPL